MKKILKRIFLSIAFIIGIGKIYLFYYDYQAGIITNGDKIPEYDTVRSALLIVDIREATTGKVSDNKQYILKNIMLEKFKSSGVSIIKTSEFLRISSL